MTKKSKSSNKKSDKSKKKGLFKYVSLKTLVILLVMLMFNSYAWFIFATKVSGSLQIHVNSWNVSFKLGETESSTNLIIDVGRVYPGMSTFEKIVSVINDGETKASLTYRYKKIVLFGITYEIGDEYTEEDLRNIMEVDNPFKISVVMKNAGLINGTEDGSFTIHVDWPYESGDDALDTSWGEEAYEYFKENGNASSLIIEMDLIAEQLNETNSTEQNPDEEPIAP